MCAGAETSAWSMCAATKASGAMGVVRTWAVLGGTEVVFAITIRVYARIYGVGSI